MKTLKVTKEDLRDIKSLATSIYLENSVGCLSAEEYTTRCWIQAVLSLVPEKYKAEFPEVHEYIAAEDY